MLRRKDLVKPLFSRSSKINCWILPNFIVQTRQRSDYKPKSSVSPGRFHTPIVDKLWQSRQANENSAESVAKGRPPSWSRIEVVYEFSTNEVLVEQYSNPWGFIRMGRVLEDLDALAGNIAAAHCKGTPVPLVIVTASVDQIKMRCRANIQENMKLSGAVSWVGSSSMQIDMKATSGESAEPWLVRNKKIA